MKRSSSVFIRALRHVGLVGRYCRHRLNPRASYADDREDIAAEALLGGVRRFIDIGANDGITCSNTLLAALRGARGLCFEPNPADYRRLRSLYLLARRIECVPVGLSESAGVLELRCDGLLSAITSTEDTGLSELLAPHQQAGAPVTRITVERLSDWLNRRPDFYPCDLLSLDVEGHELNVLHGVDWTRHPKPGRLLVVETHAVGRGGQWRHRDFDSIADLLAERGFLKLAASRNNTLWLHREDRHAERVALAKQQCPHYTWFDDEPSNES